MKSAEKLPTLFYRIFIAALLISISSLSVHAQNVAGVFPPGFGPDHASFQYRAGFDPDSDGLVQRGHYQRSIDDRKMWRVVAQVNKTNDAFLDLDRVVGELFWTLTDPGSAWQHGIRFDAALRTEGRPGIAAVNWSSQYAGIEGWRFRFNVLNGVQIGDGRASGVFMQTRAQIHRPLDKGRAVGIEHFGQYGSTDDFRDFKDQRQQIGPYMILPIGDAWRVHGSLLFGVTDASPDSNFTIWVNRGF
ncbi:MAG: hypothetical protein AB8F65_12290 [Woeseiaceae bacterium]